MGLLPDQSEMWHMSAGRHALPLRNTVDENLPDGVDIILKCIYNSYATMTAETKLRNAEIKSNAGAGQFVLSSRTVLGCLFRLWL